MNAYLVPFENQETVWIKYNAKVSASSKEEAFKKIQSIVSKDQSPHCEFDCEIVEITEHLTDRHFEKFSMDDYSLNDVCLQTKDMTSKEIMNLICFEKKVPFLDKKDEKYIYQLLYREGLCDNSISKITNRINIDKSIFNSISMKKQIKKEVITGIKVEDLLTMQDKQYHFMNDGVVEIDFKEAMNITRLNIQIKKLPTCWNEKIALSLGYSSDNMAFRKFSGLKRLIAFCNEFSKEMKIDFNKEIRC